MTSPSYRLRTRPRIIWGGLQAPAATQPPQSQFNMDQRLKIRNELMCLNAPSVYEVCPKLPRCVAVRWVRTISWFRGSRQKALRQPCLAITSFLPETDEFSDLHGHKTTSEQVAKDLSAICECKDIFGVYPVSFVGRLCWLSAVEFHRSAEVAGLRDQMLSEAVATPEGSYQFLGALSPTRKELSELLPTISKSPRHALYTLRYSHLSIDKATTRTLINALSAVPLYEWIYYVGDPLSEVAAAVEGNSANEASAALGLMLQPNSQNAESQAQRIKTNSRLSLQVSLVLRSTTKMNSNCPLINDLKSTFAGLETFLWYLNEASIENPFEISELNDHLEWIAELIDAVGWDEPFPPQQYDDLSPFAKAFNEFLEHRYTIINESH